MMASVSTDVAGQRSARLEQRRSRLAGRAQALRTRARSGRYDRWLLAIGGVLVVLGILAIVLGWLGASNTAVVFEQIPFVISGGLLGLALVFAGVMTYFAYWLTVVVRENREMRRQVAASQQQLADALDAIGEALTAPRRRSR
jgi:Flp pilus assembly protein TadB